MSIKTIILQLLSDSRTASDRARSQQYRSETETFRNEAETIRDQVSNVEFTKDNGNLVWRFADDPLNPWNTIVALSELTGDDGRSPEFQKSATHIQYRLVGDADWINLVPLSELVGAAGEDAKEIEIQKGATHIQWRRVGDASWNDIVATADLAGTDGKNIELQANSTHIQWREKGTVSWTDLVPFSTLAGDDGREVEITNDGTNIKWKYTGQTIWNTLVSLASISGSDGADGADGSSGDRGWSPLLTVKEDGDRRVLQVTNWIGGQGAKPATGSYIGTNDFVANIIDAVDIRGAQGVKGDAGEKGDPIDPLDYTAKGTIDDGDKFPGFDSENADNPVTWLWSVIKSTFKSYYDAVTATLTNKTMIDASNKIHAEEVYALARNSSGATITRGQAVSVSGYNVGQELPEVELSNSSDAAKMPALGIAVDDIPNNETGKIVIVGILEDVDTSAYSVGDSLYVAETDGALTNVKPTADGSEVQIVGTVFRSNVATGVIEIQIAPEPLKILPTVDSDAVSKKYSDSQKHLNATNSQTEKTDLADDDSFPIQEVGGTVKRVEYTNLLDKGYKAVELYDRILFAEDFDYPNGTVLDSNNGWTEWSGSIDIYKKTAGLNGSGVGVVVKDVPFNTGISWGTYLEPYVSRELHFWASNGGNQTARKSGVVIGYDANNYLAFVNTFLSLSVYEVENGVETLLANCSIGSNRNRPLIEFKVYQANDGGWAMWTNNDYVDIGVPSIISNAPNGKLDWTKVGVYSSNSGARVPGIKVTQLG